METKEMIDALSKMLEDKLPEVAGGMVETAVNEKFAEVTDAIKELNENVKLWNLEKAGMQKKAETQEVMGQYFRKMLKKDTAGANAVLKEYAIKATYLNEWVDADGWYMVPAEFAKEVFYTAGEYGLARRLSTIVPMGTDTKNISSLTNSIVAYWTSEWVAYTGSKQTTGQIQLIAYKATALVSSTLELIDDNQTNQEIWNITKTLIAEKLAEFEDTNVFNTSTKFTSLLDDTNVNTITMGAGDTSFADISYDDLIDLVRAVAMKYKKGKPAFFMSQDNIAYVEKLKDSNGQPIFFSTRDIKTGQITNRLLWFDLYLTDVMPWTADDAVSTEFVLFGDMKYWAFGDRRQLTMEFGYTSGNWEKDIQSLKASERIAGAVLDANAFAKLKTAAA